MSRQDAAPLEAEAADFETSKGVKVCLCTQRIHMHAVVVQWAGGGGGGSQIYSLQLGCARDHDGRAILHYHPRCPRCCVAGDQHA